MWFGITLAGLAALTAAVLWIPLDVILRLEADGRLYFSARLVWLFGLVSKELGRKQGSVVERWEAVRERPNRAGRRNAVAKYRILRARGLFLRLVKLLGDVLRRLQVRELAVDFRVGLDDPADTGLLFAVVGPAALMLGQALSRPISVQPAFDAAVLEGYCHGSVRVRPIGLLPPVLRFILSPPALRAAAQAVSGKWKHGE